ncbi:hypothetical protein [Chelatococcus sp. GW1]
MRAIRSKDTRPELVVRKTLRNLGFTGYRLHRRDLPGRPDIAFIGRRKAIFVHGCFWHGQTVGRAAAGHGHARIIGYRKFRAIRLETPNTVLRWPMLAGRFWLSGTAKPTMMISRTAFRHS